MSSTWQYPSNEEIIYLIITILISESFLMKVYWIKLIAVGNHIQQLTFPHRFWLNGYIHGWHTDILWERYKQVLSDLLMCVTLFCTGPTVSVMWAGVLYRTNSVCDVGRCSVQDQQCLWCGPVFCTGPTVCDVGWCSVQDQQCLWCGPVFCTGPTVCDVGWCSVQDQQCLWCGPVFTQTGRILHSTAGTNAVKLHRKCVIMWV